MKKLLLIAIAIIMIANPLFAVNDLSALSAESQQKYLMESLSIQTEENTVATGSGFGNMIGSTAIMTSVGRGTTETEWYPYKGPSELTREEFYTLTNQNDLLEAYTEGTKKQTIANICGWALLGVTFIGGLVVCFTGLESGNTSAEWIGLSVALIGGLGSIPLVTWEYDDNVSISFAVGLADIYNNNLYKSLK